jgi:NAD(P)-dependent dehydrogenase (short-subunit alcohol dehydrogenase family)
LIGLTKANAVELTPIGIQVNAVAPGLYLTDMTDELRGTALERAVRHRTLAGRWGENLGSGRRLPVPGIMGADFVSGVVIRVDGGYLANRRVGPRISERSRGRSGGLPS